MQQVNISRSVVGLVSSAIFAECIYTMKREPANKGRAQVGVPCKTQDICIERRPLNPLAFSDAEI
jgi:hypothetical protein